MYVLTCLHQTERFEHPSEQIGGRMNGTRLLKKIMEWRPSSLKKRGTQENLEEGVSNPNAMSVKCLFGEHQWNMERPNDRKRTSDNHLYYLNGKN